MRAHRCGDDVSAACRRRGARCRGNDESTRIAPPLRCCTFMPTIRHDPQIGSLFQGRYELLSELGAGSFGRVYEAASCRPGRMWRSRSSASRDGARVDDDNQRERFRREMRLCGELSHPQHRPADRFGGVGRRHCSMRPSSIVPGLDPARQLLAEQGRLGAARDRPPDEPGARRAELRARPRRRAPRPQAREHHGDADRGAAERDGARLRAGRLRAGGRRLGPAAHHRDAGDDGHARATRRPSSCAASRRRPAPTSTRGG